MTALERATIAPIQCAPWCKYGGGHTAAIMRGDQVCWGSDHYVDASREELHAEYMSGQRMTWPSRVGVCAYQGFNEHPVAYVQVRCQPARLTCR